MISRSGHAYAISHTIAVDQSDVATGRHITPLRRRGGLGVSPKLLHVHMWTFAVEPLRVVFKDTFFVTLHDIVP